MLQLLQHKTYNGNGAEVNEDWDEGDMLETLSSRWLDVSTGGAVQPRETSRILDQASQLLTIGDMKGVELNWEDAYNDCSDDGRPYNSDEDRYHDEDDYDRRYHECHRCFQNDREEARAQRKEDEEHRDFRRALTLCAASLALLMPAAVLRMQLD